MCRLRPGIPIRKLKEARFAASVRALVGEKPYRENAQKISEAMRLEPKLEDLYRQIETLAAIQQQ